MKVLYVSWSNFSVNILLCVFNVLSSFYNVSFLSFSVNSSSYYDKENIGVNSKKLSNYETPYCGASSYSAQSFGSLTYETPSYNSRSYKTLRNETTRSDTSGYDTFSYETFCRSSLPSRPVSPIKPNPLVDNSWVYTSTQLPKRPKVKRRTSK